MPKANSVHSEGAKARENTVHKLNENEMYKVAAAVRTLTDLALLEIEIGVGGPVSKSYPNIGPLTVAEHKKTGELTFLWCDSYISVKPEDLTFRMTLAVPAEEDNTPVLAHGRTLLESLKGKKA
jgi:hypothetical protein